MLNIYNTLTRKVEPFQPEDPNNVKMFTCGPSTYQQPHIGNYRTFLFEDILQRYIEYLGYKVTRLMPFTDVEDKAITQAKKENLSIEKLTQKNETLLFKDFELLRIKKPDYSIRASDAVDQAVELTSKLVDSGNAYWYLYRGVKNAYFDPLKSKDFGKLAHLDMTKWPKKKKRFHKDTYPGTPWNMGDFILWHGCGMNDVCYDTKIGSGRPAWNIQDAAIVTKYLGQSVDIACGGIDNLVRHHDYNIAIIEAVSGKQFSQYWLHGAHLLVNKKKMSKSLGNVYHTDDVLAEGFGGSELRFFLIYGSYRERLNFTFEKLAKTSQQLHSLQRMVSDLKQQNKSPDQTKDKASITNEVTSIFETYMNNDLDVKTAFDSLHEKVTEIHRNRESLGERELKRVLNSLQRVDSVLQCIY